MNAVTLQPGIVLQELSVAEVEEVSGGISPGVGFAIRVGISLIGLGAAGVIVGGVAAYYIYSCSK